MYWMMNVGLVNLEMLLVNLLEKNILLVSNN